MKILCVNAGSSSLKFQVYEMPEEKVLINGYIEKIGAEDCFWTIKKDGKKTEHSKFLKDHTEAVAVLIEELISNGVVKSLDEIKGVGHRVVHGGEKYANSVIITDEVIESIKKLTKFATLHHPGNLAGIMAIQKAMPNVPMVAVYDTAFHQTMPKVNYLYPLPYDWYTDYGVRKYGFHGTSHKYITLQMQEKLGKKDVNLIICHIGSGSSIACVKDGKSIDTTMGLTPLDGLMMGTRCGSIDPSIIQYISKETGMSLDEIDNCMNKKSGFLGVCGQADCRDVESLCDKNDEQAKLAYEMYVDRAVKYIAEYFVKLGGKVDAIVFTAGVGENGPIFREMVLKKLSCLGIKLDEAANNTIARFLQYSEGVITTKDSSVEAIVLPTNEEYMIALDTYNLVK